MLGWGAFKIQIKELSKERAALQREGVALLETDFEKARELTHKAYKISKRCRVLLQELNTRLKIQE